MQHHFEPLDTILIEKIIQRNALTYIMLNIDNKEHTDILLGLYKYLEKVNEYCKRATDVNSTLNIQNLKLKAEIKQLQEKINILQQSNDF